MPELADHAPEPLRQPRSCTELFIAFTWLALQGFGGVIAIAQRELVERLRWLTAADFLELLSVAQVLPGPNVVNLSLMIGDRFFGLRGAFSALAGMLLVPLVIVLAAAALYARHAQHALVGNALRGMGAVSAGLVIATAIKLLPALKTSPLGTGLSVLISLLTLALVAVWRVPLWWVIVGLGSASFAAAWWRLRAR
ncbi:MAG: chromate transporter [Rhizobacter sp.]